MLKTIYKLWWKKPTQLQPVRAYVYAADEATARTKLASRISGSAEILDHVQSIDPRDIGTGTMSIVGDLIVIPGYSAPKTYPISRDNSKPQDVLTPDDLAELEADLAS